MRHGPFSKFARGKFGLHRPGMGDEVSTFDGIRHRLLNWIDGDSNNWEIVLNGNIEV